MKLEDIYTYYQTPQPIFLNQELAVCYVLSVLLKGDSYGTQLVQQIEKDYPNYRLSDTVLYAALRFLEEEECITGYWQKVEGRGRPRRMYQLVEEKHSQATELASLWENYVQRSPVSLPVPPSNH